MKLLGNSNAAGAFRGFRGLAALIAATLAIAGCETSGRIETVDSMLELRLDPGEWPSMTRDLTIKPTYRYEEWDWPNGSLYIVRGNRNRYYSNDYSDPEDMIEDIESWGATVPERFDRRDIFEDENQNGRFQYTVLNHGRRNCFYMLQPIYYTVGPNRQGPSSAESSSGNISFYECAGTGAMSMEKLEQRGLKFARALVRVW